MDTMVIIESDVERDRKECVKLDLKVTGANQALAQWLLDHPRYSGEIVGGWLGCSGSRIRRLRVWATGGFVGSPYDKSNSYPDRALTPNSPLESLGNSENGSDETGDMESDVADPATIEDNLIHSLQRMCEHARIFKKFLKASTFDREAETRIVTAIDRMIQKWRSTQATLTKRSHENGQAQTKGGIQTRSCLVHPCETGAHK